MRPGSRTGVAESNQELRATKVADVLNQEEVQAALQAAASLGDSPTNEVVDEPLTAEVDPDQVLEEEELDKPEPPKNPPPPSFGIIRRKRARSRAGRDTRGDLGLTVGSAGVHVVKGEGEGASDDVFAGTASSRLPSLQSGGGVAIGRILPRRVSAASLKVDLNDPDLPVPAADHPARPSGAGIPDSAPGIPDSPSYDDVSADPADLLAAEPVEEPLGRQAGEPLQVIDEPVQVIDEPLQVIDEPLQIIDEPLQIIDEPAPPVPSDDELIALAQSEVEEALDAAEEAAEPAAPAPPSLKGLHIPTPAGHEEPSEPAAGGAKPKFALPKLKRALAKLDAERAESAAAENEPADAPEEAELPAEDLELPAEDLFELPEEEVPASDELAESSSDALVGDEEIGAEEDDFEIVGDEEVPADEEDDELAEFDAQLEAPASEAPQDVSADEELDLAPPSNSPAVVYGLILLVAILAIAAAIAFL